MMWPTWQQAMALATASGVLLLALDRAEPTRRRNGVRAATVEVGILAALYAIWRIARKLPFATTEGAIERARWIDRFERATFMPSELSLQQFVLDHAWIGRFLNTYYAVMHVPALLAFLVWLYVRHRDSFPHWRNGLAFLTGTCLVIRFLRVAPPRLVPDLGYIDLADIFGFSVYGPMGTGVSDQLAAMPSIHVGWAAVVSFGVVATSTSRWRWVFLLHVVITLIAVSATGHHWWVDGLVAIALLWLGLWADTAVRRSLAARRETVPESAA
ncbi:MAG: hypothetical protein RLZZ362_522 [Actinomycetota bacterium]|jgi:hypothetical protein